MTIRVYLFQENPVQGTFAPLYAYLSMRVLAKSKWGDGVMHGSIPGYDYAVWIEFDSEEEAALFKLTHL